MEKSSEGSIVLVETKHARFGIASFLACIIAKGCEIVPNTGGTIPMECRTWGLYHKTFYGGNKFRNVLS